MDALKTAETYCEKLDSMVHSLNSIVQVLPSMLGTESHANDAPRNYLILAQTNAEARPFGGLTGSLGLATVQGGHVSLQPFVSDSEIQNADEPVVDLTAEERLLFTDKLGKDIRDVNFTPDFPRTGEIVSAMWNRQYGVAVDGVIAIDPLFLQNMLAVTGGVVMPDGSTLDGANTAQTLLHDVYARMTSQETDEYFAVAAQAAFDHIMQNAGNFKSYVKALSTSVEQGHVMVWSAHEDEQNLIADSAISGKLITEGAKPQVGVYISDETESKMDWYLHREVTTEFQKVARNGANQYTVHIKLQNTITAEEAASEADYVTGGGNIVPKGQIKTALFIYAPANGRLVDWEGAADVFLETERKDFRMFSPEERERAVELYFTTPMTTAQVVRHLGYPTRQCLERWLAKDPRYAGHMAKPIIPLETRTKAIELVLGGMRGSRPPDSSA